jgi:hypothetical protein
MRAITKFPRLAPSPLLAAALLASCVVDGPERTVAPRGPVPSPEIAVGPTPIGSGGSGPTVLRHAVTTGPITAMPSPTIAAGGLNVSAGSLLLWQNTRTGDRGFWPLAGPYASGGWIPLANLSTIWNIECAGDFDADGSADLLWRQTSTGQMGFWMLNGPTVKSGYLPLTTIDTRWRVIACPDVSGDGRPDLMWRSAGGEIGFWIMDGAFPSASGYIPLTTIAAVWEVAAVADFSGDGKPDILWQNDTTGDRGFWTLNGTSMGQGWRPLTVVPPRWKIRLASDASGDGKNDILWENTVTGERGWWFLDGMVASSSGYVPLTTIAGEWAHVAVLAGTPPPTTGPAAPADLQATDGPASVSLSWADESTDEARFEVERRSTGGSFALLATLPAGTTSYRDAPLAMGAAYEYRVRACSGSRCSDYSNAAAGRTAAVTSLTSGVPATDLAMGAGTVRWYALDVPAGSASLIVTLTGYSGDPWTRGSVSVLRDSPDAVPACAGGTTLNAGVQCAVPAPAAARWLIRLEALDGFTGGVLVASHQASQLVAPTVLVAQAQSATDAEVRFIDNSVGETEYRLEIRESGTTVFGRASGVQANRLLMRITGLLPGTTYDFRLNACDASRCAPAPIVTVTTPRAEPVRNGVAVPVSAPPMLLNQWYAIEVPSGQGTLSATVSGSGNLADVQLVPGSTDGVPACMSSTDSPTCTVSNPSAGTWYVRVGSYGAFTGAILTVTHSGARPATPGKLSFSWLSPIELVLSWDRIQGATYYLIERRISPGGAYAIVGTAWGNATSYTDGGLRPETIYVYRIKACNEFGCSGWTQSEGAKTGTALPAILIPSELTLASSSSQVTVGWKDNSTNESGFEVQRRTLPSGSFSRIATTSANATSYADRAVSSGQSYEYRVRACAGTTCSAYAGPSSITYGSVTVPKPAAPSAVSATAAGSRNVRVSWSDNSSDEAGFWIERRLLPSGTFATVGAVGPNLRSFDDDGVSPGGAYEFRVYACSTAACSDPSPAASVTMPSPYAACKRGTLSFGRTETDAIDDIVLDNSQVTLLRAGQGWPCPENIVAFSLDAAITGSGVARPLVVWMTGYSGYTARLVTATGAEGGASSTPASWPANSGAFTAGPLAAASGGYVAFRSDTYTTSAAGWLSSPCGVSLAIGAPAASMDVTLAKATGLCIGSANRFGQHHLFAAGSPQTLHLRVEGVRDSNGDAASARVCLMSAGGGGGTEPVSLTCASAAGAVSLNWPITAGLYAVSVEIRFGGTYGIRAYY